MIRVYEECSSMSLQYNKTVILELVENAPHNAFIFNWIFQEMNSAPSICQIE
jgi:hypothetical protein